MTAAEFSREEYLLLRRLASTLDSTPSAVRPASTEGLLRRWRRMTGEKRPLRAVAHDAYVRPVRLGPLCPRDLTPLERMARGLNGPDYWGCPACDGEWHH